MASRMLSPNLPLRPPSTAAARLCRRVCGQDEADKVVHGQRSIKSSCARRFLRGTSGDGKRVGTPGTHRTKPRLYRLVIARAIWKNKGGLLSVRIASFRLRAPLWVRSPRSPIASTVRSLHPLVPYTSKRSKGRSTYHLCNAHEEESGTCRCLRGDEGVGGGDEGRRGRFSVRVATAPLSTTIHPALEGCMDAPLEESGKWYEQLHLRRRVVFPHSIPPPSLPPPLDKRSPRLQARLTPLAGKHHRSLYHRSWPSICTAAAKTMRTRWGWGSNIGVDTVFPLYGVAREG
ncbi:hypothetical protein C8R45DRAFT_966201 [Mycena sanguinolenta]|nr:hypothetical protein C8R45DRAFT_966201 [Mycena sanguinolenta]